MSAEAPPEARGVRRLESCAPEARTHQQEQGSPGRPAAVAVAAVVGTTVGYAALGKSVTLNVDGQTST